MQTFVATRGIPSLLHFTRLANLPAILANGIMPRHTLIEGGVPFEHNDEIRLDGHQDASCFTIGWPNYKMFYTARCNNPGVKWAVIECSSSILWEKDCIFSAENAASGTARAVPDVVRRGVLGIRAMYAETVGKPTRAEMGLPAHFPTNPQAEVLVFGVVEPRYFLHVHIDDWQSRQAFAAAHATLSFRGGWEGPRADYQHWR